MANEKTESKKPRKPRNHPARNQDICIDQFEELVAGYLVPVIESLNATVATMRKEKIASLSIEHAGMATNGIEAVRRMAASAAAEVSLAIKPSVRSLLFGTDSGKK